MTRIFVQGRRIATMLCVLLIASACFQAVGDEAQINQVAQGIPTDLPTEAPTETETRLPSETPEGTEEVVEATEETTEEATEEVIVAQVIETQTATPTNTPSPTVTPSPEAVDELAGERATPVGQAVAQVDEQDDTAGDDPFVLTATQFVREVTQTAEAPLTQTAEALGLGASPTPEPTLGEIIQQPSLETATPTPFVSGADCQHQLLPGENLFRLSLRYGVSINQLAAASGITNPQLILAGTRITIPGCGTTGAVPPAFTLPVPGEEPVTQDLSFSAQGAGTGTTTGTTTGSVTGTTTGTGGAVQTSTCASIYVVEQYDTLFQISLECNVPLQSIINANPSLITNMNFLLIGWELTIPPN